MPRPSLPIAVTLAVLLGLGAAGCANTPQPPSASGEVGSGEAPTGTAPATTTAAPSVTEVPSSTASSSSSTPRTSTSTSSKPSQTALNGAAKPFPKVPVPSGTLVLDTSSTQSGTTTWTRSYRTQGVQPRALASDLQKQFQAAGFRIGQQTSIPSGAGGGKVFTASNSAYQASVVVNTTTSDGTSAVGTTINVTQL